MDQSAMTNIFLSASIPKPERDPAFYTTADTMAIRDAVRALSIVIIPKTRLIWGGHPAITPLIRFVMDRMSSNVKEHVTLYQSHFFKDFFPEDNGQFEHVEITPTVENDRQKSLDFMRKKMIDEHDYSVGIFIGGMEGVLEEYDLFKSTHPKALILPIASTGAAARIIYDEISPTIDTEMRKDLTSNYAYMATFRKLLINYL